MPTQDKKPDSKKRLGPAVQRGAKHSGDPTSKKLGALGQKIGNEALGGQIQGSAQQRDSILRFVCQRLEGMAKVQQREHQSLTEWRTWFRQVARGQEGHHLPNPTRWHEAAELYQRAGQALCGGDLGRGADLAQKAMEAEAAAFDSLPQHIAEQLETTTRGPAEPPVTAGSLKQTASCPVIAAPQGLVIATQILNLQDRPEPVPYPVTRKPQWWEEGPEEDENAEEGDD